MDKIEQEKLEELYMRLMSESQTISVALNSKPDFELLQLIASNQVNTNNAFASLIKSMKNDPENAHLSADLLEMLSKAGKISKVIEKSLKDEPHPEKGEN